MVSGLPRLVIAAPGSGHGKTTVASGLMGALRAEGLEVAGFKIGPDYIDPGYHTLATGGPDAISIRHLCRPDQMVPLLLHGAEVPRPADIAVVEGVMGLFDGQIGSEGYASTAHVAGLINAPVVVVLDISHMSRTAAAVVHGLSTFEPGLRLAGVILNKAGSARHAREVVIGSGGHRDRGPRRPAPRRRGRGSVPTPRAGSGGRARRRQRRPWTGWPGRSPSTSTSPRCSRWPTRHPPSTANPGGPRSHVSPAVRSATGGRRRRRSRLHVPLPGDRRIAPGRRLRAGDLRPVRDDRLPEGTAGLYLGGGFPEVHAADLAGNIAMIDAVPSTRSPPACRPSPSAPACSTSAAPSTVSRWWGRCPRTPTMTPRLVLGYRTGVADHDHLLGPAGTRVTGHEFHRTAVTSTADPGGVAAGRPARRLLARSGRNRSADAARQLPAHALGRPPAAWRSASPTLHMRTRATAASTSSGREVRPEDLRSSRRRRGGGRPGRSGR